ncbi:MAG TPA: hypothetical protein VN701_00985 [Candidatus Paceibacterota bacterium]|nr:hypothetical protein [Candidatus Paceibacterota bacterium]
MQELLTLVVAHPYSDVEIFMSLWGAFGVIMFSWGLCSFVLSHGHVGHQDHARAQMIWGVMLTGSAIIVWEGIRFLASLFT